MRGADLAFYLSAVFLAVALQDWRIYWLMVIAWLLGMARGMDEVKP